MYRPETAGHGTTVWQIFCPDLLDVNSRFHLFIWHSCSFHIMFVYKKICTNMSQFCSGKFSLTLKSRYTLCYVLKYKVFNMKYLGRTDFLRLLFSPSPPPPPLPSSSSPPPPPPSRGQRTRSSQGPAGPSCPSARRRQNPRDQSRWMHRWRHLVPAGSSWSFRRCRRVTL